ncbi:damage-control phosphatase ARMT1 family protein [Caloranaerobacter ferrireducens]|uniref:damage-control phosphatase ARMT1 family protein n=1 Tax=Caloranaerobacter ferrireducens TaxID=1323370 RepID=UPI00084D737D|nr:ARMT1-like domain-containing protein [Caloranaerobacter ferrireducens]
MNTHVDCIACVISKANKLADKYFEDKHQKYSFMNKVLREVADIDYDRTAPFLVAKVMRILKKETGIDDFYFEEKRLFNKKLLSMEKQIEDILNNSNNKFVTALKIALAGNIIDFGALDEISFDLVEEIINKTLESDFDEELCKRLMDELSKSKMLLYLADNAGEIVFDKIFIREITREYPDIKIFFAVRGKPVLNDANEEDAYFVGINEYATIINNGTDLPGTDLLEVSDEFKEIFNKADIIISKGQGNFESLPGCGKNVYYLFLCKCDLLMKKFKSEKLSNIFIHESSL